MADGQIDRRALASRVFGNPENLARLNRLVHPHVVRREEQLIASLAELPTAARAALLERFELMLDSALTVSGARRMVKLAVL